MKKILFIFSLMILSCTSQKTVVKKKEREEIKEVNMNKTDITNDSTNENTLDITLLTEGTHGGFKDAKTLIIKDPKELQEIYSQINMMRRPGLPIPEIDFENEMVIVLFMGEKTSGDYATKVEKVIEKDNSLEIVIKESVPKGITTTVICQPFYFCKINRSNKEIVFKKAD